MGEQRQQTAKERQALELLSTVDDSRRKLRGSLNEGMAEAFALLVAVFVSRLVTGDRSDETSPLVFAVMTTAMALYAAWIARMFLSRRDYGLGVDRRYALGLGLTFVAAVVAGLLLQDVALDAANGAILMSAALILGRVLRQPALAALGGMLALNITIADTDPPWVVLLASPIAWVLLVMFVLRRWFEK